MDITSVLAAYVHDVTADGLRASVRLVESHLEVVRAVAKDRDFVDVGLAEKISGVLHALVDDADSYTARERALLAGAMRYFTKADDENSDMTSPTGFDDDTEVLNAVCRYVGRAELCIEVS